MKTIFVFRYLKVYFAAIIILQVIRCRHNIVDCHFCLGRRWWECFIGKLGFLTYWKSILEIMSNQSCFNIETTVGHLNNVDLLLTGRRKMHNFLHPRLMDAMQKGDRRLKPHALRKKIRVKNISFFFSPEGIWGRSLVSCWRTGCSLHSSACAQSFDPRPWAFVWNQL